MVLLFLGLNADGVVLFVIWTVVTVLIAAVTRRPPREALLMGALLGPLGAAIELVIVLWTLYQRWYDR